ncbi:TetR family transcriptional regulator [Streptomyces sp. NPDC050287]
MSAEPGCCSADVSPGADEIAEAAEVATATLFAYFPTKSR